MSQYFRRLRHTFPSGKPLAAFLASIAVLLIVIILLEWPVLLHTHGKLILPTDDAFVNVSVARNLSFYQVWGISKHSFQSASSSLLYPLILAPVFFITGAHLLIPLLINFLAAIYFLLVLQRILIKNGLSAGRQFVILLEVMALTVLPLLVVSGTEYTLQLLFVFLFMDALSRALSDPMAQAATAKTTLPRRVYILGLLIVATRYEDMLIIALACLLLAPLRGWRTALRLACLSILPVFLFGLISMAKGSYFLPNTLLMGPYPGYAIFLTFCALCAAVPLLGTWLRFPSPEKTKAIPWLSLVLLAILALPFATRNLGALSHFKRDCIRMYDQEYLTAGFIHLYYYKMTVGTDEPGAASWFSEGRKLDYTGIANDEVIRSKKRHHWSPVYADSLSRRDGIRAAIVTDPWFDPGQLPKWNIIATWVIPDSSPGAARTISFYAINQYDTARLRRNLHDYQHLLPGDVAVRYY
jgi:hypothetical protein